MFIRRLMMAGIALCLMMPLVWLRGAGESSGGSPHFLAYLSTDKPIYRDGEKVYLRAVVLNADDHRPLPQNQPAMAALQITGPKGEILFNSWAGSEDSVAALNWDIPPDAPGGQFKATVSFPNNGYPPAQRKFEVRAYRAPRLKGEIIFLRDGYGPGDTVKASLHVERAEGGLPAGANVTVSAIVDGVDAYAGNSRIDASGNCAVEFTLPAQIEKGDGTLSLAIADGGVVEPIAKTIPIIVHSVDVSFYPEGGDLIAGLGNRVYLEARLPSQKPADLSGSIVDGRGNIVAAVRTEHEGRGRFSFTPVAGQEYSLKVSQPAGIAKLFPLPEVKATGVVVQSGGDICPKEQPVKLWLASTNGGDYVVSLAKHQTEIASQAVSLSAGQRQEISLMPASPADGVLIATVTEKATGTPVAERLIFRQAQKQLHISVKADRPSYVPAGSATVTVTATDDDGKPVAAVVGITVTDQSVLQMIEKRERAPRLAAMVMLETDVRELDDVDVYLNPADPRGPLATDLLLGTQGWRRFARQDVAKFVAAQGDAGRRAMADLQPVVIDQLEDSNEIGGGVRRHGIVFEGPVLAAPASFAAPVSRAQAAAEKEDKLADKPAGDFVLADALPDDGQQKQAEAAAQPAAQMQGMLRSMMRPIPVIRIYAHDLLAGHQPADRNDFTETLFWSAGLKTDPATGVATATFKLNDSVTSFLVAADGFGSDGRIGTGETIISSVQPFFIEPKLPLAVSAGDVIHLPISLVNATLDDMKAVTLRLDCAPGITVSLPEPFDLPAGARQRQMADVVVGASPGTSDFVVHAQAGAYQDNVTRHLLVEPTGFPTESARGGLLAPNGQVTQMVEVPTTLVPGSVVTSAALYPTPMGNLNEALKRLMVEPNGCFEQTTSTNYPLVMADQYFLTHSGVDPAVIAKTSELLDSGYNRLIGFECAKKGYEWFGEDPGHECLSAYGLLEFTDMAKVRNVDQAMLQDTRNWLLARRDGTGGYSHERRSLHTWVTDPGCANGYCTWALLECGQQHLDKEVAWLKNRGEADPNSYVTALAANVMFLAGDKAAAAAFMDRLASQQDKDGHVRGAITSVVGSEGDSLQIETTSLATLAWLRDPAYTANVESAIHFLADSCEGGRYGSTQSTVLALRAIVAYDKARAHPTAAGSVQLIVDNNPVGDALAFDSNSQGAIQLPDFTSRMTPGKHTVALKMSDGSPLPFALAVNFNSTIPASSDRCKLLIATKLKDAEMAEGGITEVDATVTNLTDQTVPTPIAIIGLPGGLEVRYDQLKELVKAQRIAAYEVRGREVILYWRDLQPRACVQIPLSVTAAIPGVFTGPASRAYLYYSDEFKQWNAGMKVTIKAQAVRGS
jgi:uncharacterized protein YfaS (alpha-2-macroglobulin family)